MNIINKRLSMLVVSLLSFAVTTIAQVTTSGITGVVMAGGEEAIGATVTAKHVASGSVYRAVTNIDGHYTITGMRAGGPYDVDVSYIGYQTSKFTGVQLSLGQNAVIDAVLKEEGELLQEIVIVASANNTMRSDRSGAVTNLNANQMAAIPTVGRSMTDLMKMTPQSSSSSGMAIGGGNYRQSSVTIDGASFNNSFGLGASPLPGGGTPISLDALDQMTVSITPYDVRQSGFTGGGINAVTKSGTNEFKGSAYTYLTSTSLKGARVATTTLPVDDGHSNTYGLTFGGPIIKDKLFFFFNGEIEDNVTTGPTARAGDGSTPYTNTNRRPQIEELESLSSYLQNTYGLTTGPWQGYNVKTPAYRILARIDWNINENHKFNVRLTKSNRKASSPASASRSIGSNQATKIYGGNQNTYGSNTNYGMSSLSSRYYAEYRFTSVAAELNSKFGKLQNTLRGTYSFQDQPRSTEYNEQRSALIVVRCIRVEGADPHVVRGVDEPAAADIYSDMVDARRLFSGRGSAEEQQVTGFERVERGRSAGSGLLRGVPRQQQAVHEEGAPGKSAAVHFLDGGPAPHVRRAEETECGSGHVVTRQVPGKCPLAEIRHIAPAHPA